MFKIELGKEVKDKVSGLKGIITSRSENLNMCNRYYVQPKADKDMKIPDGWWLDEMQLKIIGSGVAPKPEKLRNGGPMGKNY